MIGHRRVHLEGTVAVNLPPQEAFELFTPTGERRWATGWDPTFVVSEPDETAPGAVFLTRHGNGKATTWIVAACDRPRSIAYCNFTDLDRASLIRVSCEASPDGTTTAHVSYDVNALSDEGEQVLQEFATHFEHYMAHWQEAIAACVGGGSRT